MDKNKVSFDFDSTLTKPSIQKLARNLITKGYDVWVVTSRCHSGYGIIYDNSDLYKVTDYIGIKRENIIFTQANYKSKYLDDGFIFHIDDDKNEIARIKNIKCVDVNESYCIRQVYSILSEHRTCEQSEKASNGI